MPREAQDREKWKGMVRERINHLEEYEKQKGQHHDRIRERWVTNRNVEGEGGGEVDLRCNFPRLQ